MLLKANIDDSHYPDPPTTRPPIRACTQSDPDRARGIGRRVRGVRGLCGEHRQASDHDSSDHDSSDHDDDPDRYDGLHPSHHSPDDHDDGLHHDPVGHYYLLLVRR
jgi:hypothetical protein